MESYNFEKNIFPTTSKKIVYEKDPNNNNESSIIISPPLSPKKYSSKKKDRYNNTDGNDNDNDGGIIVNLTNETVQKPSTTFNNIQDVYDYLASCDKPRYRMKWCEIPNELREFIEINKKITSINHSSLPSSRTLPLPVLSTESSPINTTTGSTNANVIYVHNVAAGSSSSSSSQTYDGRHVYTSSFSSPPLPPPSSISSTTTTTPPSFDVMRIDIINNNNIISNNNNNNNGKKEFSHGHHRHQPYSTKPFKFNDKAFSYKRSNIKGKERGIYEDNRFNTYMSSINTTSTLGQSSGTCSSDSTPPISPKNYNNKSLSHIITKKQQRKKSSNNNNNNNNNIRRSSDVNAISINRQYGIIKSNSASSTIAERKRKSNSLARVMADRGLFEESIIPIISSTSNSGEVKSIRIPPSPPLEYEKLIENLNNMNLKNGILNTAEPNITWKGQSLSITHLPHYDALHPKEAFVASALRLTPVQYLTAKHTLVSAAQRYSQRNFPFKKSDAQKLLRIDVNKASKLWEFFRQVEWI